MPSIKAPLFNAGEGISQTDFNDMRDLLRRDMYDVLRYDHAALASFNTFSANGQPTHGGDFLHHDDDVTSNTRTFEDVSFEFDTNLFVQRHAWMMGPSAGRVVTDDNGGAGPMTWALMPGTMGQYIGSTYPNTSGNSFLYYPVSVGEFSGSFATNIGGGANRIDCVQMKLETVSDTPTSVDFKDAITGALTTQNVNKRVATQCTVSVKQGTPGAGRPEPDAGYVPLAYVTIDDVADDILTTAQHSMPHGKLRMYSAGSVHAHAPGWSPKSTGSAGKHSLEASAPGDRAIVPLIPHSTPWARILKIRLSIDSASGLNTLRLGGSGSNELAGILHNLLVSMPHMASSGAHLAVMKFFANTPTDDQTNGYFPPLWNSGGRNWEPPSLGPSVTGAPLDDFTAGDPQQSIMLEITAGSAGDELRSVEVLYLDF